MRPGCGGFLIGIAVVSRVYPTTHFGFRKITVELPLRLDFQASPERLARLDDERAFVNLAMSRKKGTAKGKDEDAGREQQAAIRALLRSLPNKLFLDRKPSRPSFQRRRERRSSRSPRPSGRPFSPHCPSVTTRRRSA